MLLEVKYVDACRTPSDINEHLPALRYYASACDSVVECGVRYAVSSFAFATALYRNPVNKLVMVDPFKSNNIEPFLAMCSAEGVNAEFQEKSDLDFVCDTDLLFIDTWHIYGQLKRELAHWHGHVAKYIILHDTTVDAERGETIRNGWDAVKQSKETGIPVEEITKGLWPAVEEFLAEHPEWKLERRFTHNNGLTVLRRVQE